MHTIIKYNDELFQCLIFPDPFKYQIVEFFCKSRRTCSGLVSWTTNGKSSSIPPLLLLLLPTIDGGGPNDPVDDDDDVDGCDIPPAAAAAAAAAVAAAAAAADAVAVVFIIAQYQSLTGIHNFCFFFFFLNLARIVLYYIVHTKYTYIHMNYGTVQKKSNLRIRLSLVS